METAPGRQRFRSRNAAAALRVDRLNRALARQGAATLHRECYCGDTRRKTIAASVDLLQRAAGLNAAPRGNIAPPAGFGPAMAQRPAPPRLRYVEGEEPGYTRRRRGKGWQYLTARGRPVRSAKVIARLQALALPPAYCDAWYARDPAAHLQATGIDARGRKQYRYHPEFRAAREDEKFGGCAAFGRALPAIRRAVERDLARRDLAKPRVVAAVVRLLDRGTVRVGNAAYARQNKSFGATTLRNRHARVSSARVVLDYVGKSGIRHRIGIADARLARVVRRCQDLPGQELFQYVGADGMLHPVSSQDVNDWLRDNGGEGFSAKHFRTWGASVIAFEAQARAGGRTRLKPLLAEVAERLGNTPAVARKSYVHPRIVEAVLDPPERDWRLPRASRWLTRAERGLIGFLAESG